MTLWTPEYIDTALWLDAADLTTVFASKWLDKSKNHWDAIPIQSGSMPETTTVADGKNALLFNGSTHGLWLVEQGGDLVRDVGEYTVFHVARFDESGVSSLNILRAEIPTAGSLRNSPGMESLGIRRLDDDSFTSIGYGLPALDGFTLTAHATDYINGNAYVGRDGAEPILYSSGFNGGGLTSATRSNKVLIGASFISFIAQQFKGEICEIIALRYLTAESDRRKIEGYLAHKWGIAYKLPSTHPYKTSAPVFPSVLITLTESLEATNFRVTANRVSDGVSVRDTVITQSGSVSLPSSESVYLTVSPDIGASWQPSTAYGLDDKVFPTDPASTPYYYKCTTAGTTGETEPTWPTSTGTVSDGTAVWTFVERLVQPITQGPLVPV